MPRRAFTLLEVLLATSMASLVVFSALGVMAMMQRSDSMLSRRYETVTELATLHGVFNRAFQSLVFATTDATDPTEAETPTLTGIGAALTAAFEADVRPRIILSSDASALAAASPAFDPATWGMGAPQSLELVLDDVPVNYALPATFDTLNLEGLALTPGATRGVFEAIPDDENPGTLAIWWRPVRADGTAWAELGFDRRQYAIRLAGNIVLFRIQFFRDGERQTEFTATTERDIPAYVEVEIRTADNMYFNWMFEVNKRTGPEQDLIDATVTSDDDEAADGDGATDESSGGSGSPTGTPGAGRPGGGRPNTTRPGQPGGTRPGTPGGQRPAQPGTQPGRQPGNSPGGQPRTPPANSGGGQ